MRIYRPVLPHEKERCQTCRIGGVRVMTYDREDVTKSTDQLANELVAHFGWPILMREAKADRFGHKHDVMGFADLVVRVDAHFLAIQYTDGTNFSKRVKKVLAAPKAPEWLRGGGRIQVWGFCERVKDKEVVGLKLRRRTITLADFEGGQDGGREAGKA